MGRRSNKEQQRLKRRLAGLERESNRLIDAYQSGVIELDDPQRTARANR